MGLLLGVPPGRSGKQRGEKGGGGGPGLRNQMLRYQPTRRTPPERWRRGARAQDPQGGERRCLEHVHYNPTVQQVNIARFVNLFICGGPINSICPAMNIPMVPKFHNNLRNQERNRKLPHSNPRNGIPITTRLG